MSKYSDPLAHLAHIERLEAQLEEQKRLTSHYMERHERAIASVVNLEEQVENLVERNGNQFGIIKRLQGEVQDLAGELNLARKKRSEYALAAGVVKQDTERMVARIVEAIEADGFDIAGWGNDAQLTELEGINREINDAAASLDARLDEIRTQR